MDKKEISDERKVELLEALERLPKSLWPKIFWDFPDRWPEELGDKPEDFYEAHYFICERIEDRIGSKALMRYYNVSSGNMTDQMFDDFWESSKDQLHQKGSDDTDKSANNCDCPIMTSLSTIIGALFVFFLCTLLILLVKFS